MSGTWSRKRRSATLAAPPPPPAATATTSRENFRTDQVPQPLGLQKQQQLLSRSTDRMFEEAELSGVLSLAGRKLKDFPQNLTNKYDITDLVAADLSSNRLAELPACICELRSLESLRMKANTLRRIPSNVSLLDCLTYLDLSNNQLTQLPVGLFDLPLEILLLSGNKLDTVPREIRQLSTSLQELDVSCNHLRSIPADLALLKMLRVLNLRKNFLDQFPSELCRLTLHTLDLSCNNFTQLPLHIRKMKSLVVFKITENPLQSPPASLIAKGREHIFKWMDSESGGPMPVCTTRSAYSTSTLRALNLGRSAMISSEDCDPMRKSSAPVIERRTRNARFNTVGGSDSGYASTADEHRLSHELPSAGLDDITEIAVFSPSPDEGLGETARESKKGSPMDTDSSSSGGSTSPVRQTATTTISAHLVNTTPSSNQSTQLTKKCEVRSSTSSHEIAAVDNVPPENANTEEIKKAQKIENVVVADDSNNNVKKEETVEKKTVPVIKKPLTRPISKVAPLIQSTKAIHNGNGPVKVKSTSPPTKQVSGIVQPKVNRPTAPPPSKPTGVPRSNTSTVSGVRRPTVTAPSVPSATSNKPRVQTSVAIRPIGSASTSTARTVEQKVAAPSGHLRRPTDTLRKAIPKSSSLENTSSNNVVDGMRKTLEERLGITLDKEKENLATQLADGVHLCQFANSLRIRSVSTVLTPIENTMLSSPKAKRNVDNFVAACRRLGVPEASISSPADILSKKNLDKTARTVLTLSKIFPVKSENSKKIVTNV